MITRTHPTWHTEDWQIQLTNGIANLEQLLQHLKLQPNDLPAQWQAHHNFPLRAPQGYVDKIEPGNPKDPLLLQILPQSQELNDPVGFDKDPLQEHKFTPLPGLIHKYQSRVLLTTSSTCAINCRYCFRRHFPYQEHRISQPQIAAILTYLQQQPRVNEIILSGGDPLATSNSRLERLIEQLAQLPQLTRIRIHTRLPVVIPQRIDQALLNLMDNDRFQWLMVVHSNHPQELDSDFAQAMQLLKERNITLLNQSVLLKDINDNPRILAELSEKLFACGVLPYYLHLLDPVSGANHFDVNQPDANRIYQQLLAALPGFLVPKLVREDPDQPSKTPIMPNAN